jgi:signal transduction histidine kinase/CheY-like chemotaxis protein/HPt (histidine-containing phosphotransfer) domain-containing protein
MSNNLVDVGELGVHSGEAIIALRRKMLGVGRIAGLGEVDATRLAITISEIGRLMLSSGSTGSIKVHLSGEKTIDGLALSFPEFKKTTKLLNECNYFDSLSRSETSQTVSILAVKNIRGQRIELDDLKLAQIKELLARLSRTELTGELRSKNQELEAHQINLERTVDDRTSSLIEANEELASAREKAEEATKAKAAFLATMSHEIRTPMTGVIGMVDLLTQSNLEEDQRQMMNTVRDSSYALLTIINDILDFSKIEAGKLELENVPFSIRDSLEGISETLGPNANKKGIKINIHVDPDIPDAVIGDQVRIRQILFNIGGNAVKFTESGHVKIRAFRLPVEAADKVTVRFDVTDSGIGISKEAQASLFEEFSQAESSTTRRFGGTGLGLSICLRLTEMMGGEISVASELGVGTTFSVTLSFPVAQDHDFRSDGHDLSDMKVLFVGKDAEERELDALYLRHWGAEVITIDDLVMAKEEARLAAASPAPYDLFLLGSACSLEDQIFHIKEVRQLVGLADAKYVLMTQSRTKSARTEIRDVTYVESDPIRRAPFIRGVAVAVGRASPEVTHVGDDNGGKAVRTPTVEEAEAAGSLILVAEDNLTNQNVIRRQLNMLGYAVEMVDDGKMALEAFKTDRYAILLTDCQMPVMDGYELARKIRKIEDGSDDHIPIIAITASVMAAEIERCYSAGMDDSLAKPLEMPKLSAALQKWMPVSNTEQNPGTIATDAPSPKPEDATGINNEVPEAASPIDPEALKSVFGDDQDTFVEILREYVDPAKKNINQIVTATDVRSASDVSAAAHQLKSSSRSVGANSLGEVCQALETAGNKEDWKIIEKLAPQLEPLFAKVESYIDAL